MIKTRQFTCDLVKYHAGNSNYVVHTYQFFTTVLTIVSAPDCKREKGLLKLSGAPSIETHGMFLDWVYVRTHEYHTRYKLVCIVLV